MATIFIDGFDKYGSSTSLTALKALVEQEWNYCPSNISITSPLSSTGYALKIQNSTSGPSKTLPTSYSRLIGGARIKPTNIGTPGDWGFMFTFYDHGNSQTSIAYESATGLIVLALHAFAGFVPFASSTVSMLNNTVHYLEWDITFGNPASYSVWLDTNLIISGSGRTDFTGSGTADVLKIGNPTVLGPFSMGFELDDLYLFDDTGSHNNAPLLCAPRIETKFPTGDVQAQWSSAGTPDYQYVDNNPPLGDGSSIYADTVGKEDIYSMPPLSQMPAQVFTIAVKANARRTDTTARTIDARIVSGATDSAGTNPGQTPANTYEWLDTYFDVDPNTGIAWVPANADATEAAVKVAS